MRTTCFFRSRRHCFATLWALTVMLVGCSEHSDTVVLKVGHDLTQNTSVHKAMVYMVERLNEHSGGTMQLEVYSCGQLGDRKSTRLNSSHVAISYAVFCLKKEN